MQQVIDFCFSGLSKTEVLRRLETCSGVVSYLGTRDFRDVERMAFEEGNAQAKLIFDAMVYQLSRDIASMAAVLKFEVDAIVLTGGMAYSKRLCAAVESPMIIGFFRPMLLLSGEVVKLKKEYFADKLPVHKK